MSFPFPDNDTEDYDFKLLLTNKEVFPVEFVDQLNVARRRMVSTLGSQPSSKAAISSIEEYLPLLRAVISQHERQEIAEVSKLSFKWRSILSKGICMSLTASITEKPVIANSSIWFEAINVLLTLAYAWIGMANKMVGSLATVTEAGCTEGADLLARAAGVFKLLATNWLPRWRDKKGNIPPECTVDLLLCLAELMLADANRLAMIKAQRRGMSSAILIKLASSVQTGYEQAASQLRRLRKSDADELAEPFRDYVSDGVILGEAQLLRRYAELKHEEGENGLAVASITHAANDLVKCLRSNWIPYKKAAGEMLPEYEELRKNYVRINNNVTYQRVPEIPELKSSLPVGRSIVELKVYFVPEPVSIPKDVDHKGSD